MQSLEHLTILKTSFSSVKKTIFARELGEVVEVAIVFYSV